MARGTSVDSAEAARGRAVALPCWSGLVDPQPLGGGLSNHNFLIRDDSRAYVVRISGDNLMHNVMRFNEIACARAAATTGLAPRVVYAEAHALVTDFIDGKTCEPEDAAQNLQRLTALLRRLHDEGMRALRGPVLAFSPFHVVRHYSKLLADGDSRLRRELGRFVAVADEVEAVIGATRTVLCHNDLLAANFIDAGDRLWIIDWEHAGLGAPLFDLANLASNNRFDEAAERLMLETYFEIAVTPALWRQFRAMRSLSLLREAMWSLVSELHSNIDFDFVGYSDENIAAFEAAFSDYRAL